MSRRYPERGSPPPARHVAYEISDPLLRFWFHFIFPYESALRSQPRDLAFQTILKPRLAAYWGAGFERLCRQCLPLIYLREGVAGWKAVGEYWDARVQIDVVGIRQDQWTDLGECRWAGLPSLLAVQDELEAKVQLFPQ